MKGVVLVAGASSGLGRAIAERFAREGYRTYAGARSFGGDKSPPEGCLPLSLDVTSDASVSEAVAHVLAHAGRIDVLVNCAAQLVLGACEETSDDELAGVLRTNVRGSARMVRAVLPAMRAQGAGRIIQLSSLNGRFAIAFQGAYAASKHALEGWCEALAMEVMPFGVRVTLIEPGDCRSGSQAYRQRAGAANDPDSPYARRYQAAVDKIARDEAAGMPPERVAEAVLRTVRRRRPPARVAVARLDQRLACWLHGWLPGTWFYRIISAYYAPRELRRKV